MTTISPEALLKNPFKMIGKDWLLVTAKKGNDVNTMTASWGGVGIMWNKPVAFIFLRPQRYTREFVDYAETFSLSVLGEEYRDTLTYFGTVSGRNENKIEKSGLTVEYSEETPYFAEANTVMICRKLYSQQFDPRCFSDKEIEKNNYPNNDYHIMYVAEIISTMAE